MHVVFIFLFVLFAFLCKVNAVYNKDVTCVIDPGQEPICKISPKVRRRRDSNSLTPSHDPFIPRSNTTLYNCTIPICSPVIFSSMTELTSPTMILKSCYKELTKDDDYACETLRYNHFKNIDKLLFLSMTIKGQSFYLVDCFVYEDGGRVCHRKGDEPTDSHAKLVDLGTLVRPNETNVLSQDEFICEEDKERNVQCDLNPFVPFEDGLKMKKVMKLDDNVLLKTKSYVIELKRACIGSWCGYTGQVSPSRRQYPYEPPGGKMFKCFYAKGQQVCKQSGSPRDVYNDRSFF
ncbi:hypothetical protein PYW07_001409 [Mythimna separata]|uniref:Uncharacterized protein n=1 Tax=Mythimna separata TaxID=271217 RepID=A0AAD7YV78_MYTSE|nr:hypothetical protein PYW07_001409 [Mythimna separata]